MSLSCQFLITFAADARNRGNVHQVSDSFPVELRANKRRENPFTEGFDKCLLLPVDIVQIDFAKS